MALYVNYMPVEAAWTYNPLGMDGKENLDQCYTCNCTFGNRCMCISRYITDHITQYRPNINMKIVARDNGFPEQSNSSTNKYYRGYMTPSKLDNFMEI